MTSLYSIIYTDSLIESLDSVFELDLGLRLQWPVVTDHLVAIARKMKKIWTYFNSIFWIFYPIFDKRLNNTKKDLYDPGNDGGGDVSFYLPLSESK